MKVLVYKIWILSLCVVIFLPNLNARSHGKKYTKEIKREFALNGDGELQLSNKFGRVEIRTWDRNRVKITVEIIVNAPNEAAAQKVFKKINIGFMHSPNYVKTATSVNLKNSWWEWSENKLDYAVNYHVFMPASANLIVNHAYGELYLSSLSGVVKLNLKFVDFRADALSGLVSATLKAADGSIGYARTMNLKMEGGALTLYKVGNIEIESKSAEITIGNAELVVSNCSYGSISIDKVEEFHNNSTFGNIELGLVYDAFIQSKYTTINVAEVNKYLLLDLENSSSSIKNIAKGFKEIKLIGKDADFFINLEKGTPYQLDITGYDTKFDYPKNLIFIESMNDFPYQTVRAKKNKYEKGGLIKARLKKGAFVLKN